MIKFPKTERNSSSYPQEWMSANAVVSEKLDGANVGISFDKGGNLLLQSRGHYLKGGWRERQFDLFKQEFSSRQKELWKVLGSKYVLFGEWLFAKHRIFYDSLPSYFIQYDVYDINIDKFLATNLRQQLVNSLRIPEAPILYNGPFKKLNNISQFIGKSNFKSDKWQEKYDGPKDNTDMTDLMEGVYLRVEKDNYIIGRRKLLREGFDKIKDDDKNWFNRPIVKNLLSTG